MLQNNNQVKEKHNAHLLCFIYKIDTLCPNPATSITTELIVQVLIQAVLLNKNKLIIGA